MRASPRPERKRRCAPGQRTIAHTCSRTASAAHTIKSLPRLQGSGPRSPASPQPESEPRTQRSEVSGDNARPAHTRPARHHHLAPPESEAGWERKQRPPASASTRESVTTVTGRRRPRGAAPGAAAGRAGDASHHGRRCFGYTKRYEALVPEEVALVREAIDRLFAGESLRGICFDWGARGVKTADGNAWRAHLLSRYLSSPTISAERENEGTLVPGKWPGVITAEEGLRVRTFLHRRATHAKIGTARKYVRQEWIRLGKSAATSILQFVGLYSRIPPCDGTGHWSPAATGRSRDASRWKQGEQCPTNLKLYASNSAHKVDQPRGNSHCVGRHRQSAKIAPHNARAR